MIKWMKYTSQFLLIQTIGYSLLEFVKADNIWYFMLAVSGCIYFLAQLLEET